MEILLICILICSPFLNVKPWASLAWIKEKRHRGQSLPEFLSAREHSFSTPGHLHSAFLDLRPSLQAVIKFLEVGLGKTQSQIVLFLPPKRSCICPSWFLSPTLSFAFPSAYLVLTYSCSWRAMSTWHFSSLLFCLPTLSWLLCRTLSSYTSAHFLPPILFQKSTCNSWLISMCILLVINLKGGKSKVHTLWCVFKLKNHCQNTLEDSFWHFIEVFISHSPPYPSLMKLSFLIENIFTNYFWLTVFFHFEC